MERSRLQPIDASLGRPCGRCQRQLLVRLTSARERSRRVQGLLALVASSPTFLDPKSPNILALGLLRPCFSSRLSPSFLVVQHKSHFRPTTDPIAVSANGSMGWRKVGWTDRPLTADVFLSPETGAAREARRAMQAQIAWPRRYAHYSRGPPDALDQVTQVLRVFTKTSSSYMTSVHPGCKEW
jgi:hypothetical protein